MKKENFASVRTFAIFRHYVETDYRWPFEHSNTRLNGFPWRLLEDKKCYVFYNTSLELMQGSRLMIAKNKTIFFRKFEFVALNIETFSYDVMSFEENLDWNDKEQIRRTIPYPPKYIITKNIHVDTQATNLQDFYAKISAEMAIPVAKDVAQLTDIAFERAEKVHGEDPHKLLEHFFDKNIVGIERWRTMRKLYGGCLYFDSLEMKN